MGFRFSLGNESPKYDCQTCTDKDKENRNCLNHKGLPEDMLAIEEYTEEQSDYIKENNLRKVATLKNKKEIIRMYECPVSYITQDTRDIIRLCYAIENTGHLLYDGGLANQPDWLIEALEISKKEYVLRDGTETIRNSNKG